MTVVVALYLGPLTRDRDDPPQATAVAPDVAGLPEPGGSLEPRSPAPIRLTGVDAFALRFRKPPRAALVFDVDTGEVLYRRRPLKVLPMASLTKIMTALVVTQETEPDERVRITKAALRYQGSGVGVLPKGKRVRLEALLNGLMLVSGNDAAIALAVHVSGSERKFVRLMNEKARLWGLRCTRFASSHGLEDGNRSCAADLAVLTRLAMRRPPHRADRAPPAGVVPVPDQGRPAVPRRPQPAAARRLPRRDRAEDRATPTRRGAASWAWRAAAGARWPWCCWTRPTRSSTSAKLLDLGFASG